MELKGSKTEQNLKDAFSGESQARNKYDYFSSAAKKEGYEQVAALFAETALNEKEHAKLWFKALGLLADGKTQGDTMKNLAAAAAGEHYEWTEMYKSFSQIAREEGFNEIARQFENIAKVENEHEKRYLKLYKNIETGEVWVQDSPTRWHCRNCGFIYVGTTPPVKCPACDHPRSYFERMAENY